VSGEPAEVQLGADRGSGHPDLPEVRARITRGGAVRYHQAAAAKGKLFARDRIAFLADKGSFTEDGLYANVLAAGLRADGVITGTATIASSGGTLSVTSAEFSVDMTTLASDKQMRDNRLRNDGIQTNSFPTSTFKLTSPVAIPASATSGAQVDVTLHGDLTLHGVTKTVDIPAKAQLNGSLIQVLGSLAFPFSDFSINAPNIGGFVAVEDHGTLEFLVNLTKA